MAGDDKSERGNEKQLPRPSPRKRKRNDGRHDLPESQSYDFPSLSFSSTLINGKSTFSDLASGPHLTVEIEKSDRKRWKKASMLLVAHYCRFSTSAVPTFSLSSPLLVSHITSFR